MTSKEQKERKCCYYLLHSPPFPPSPPPPPPRLRLRLKNMQSVMNSQNETIASLQAERDLMKIKYHDESTGQGIKSFILYCEGEPKSHISTCTCVLMYMCTHVHVY